MSLNTEQKQKQLRRHKQLATGLFLLMALIYIATTWISKSYPLVWIGYIRAFSEAAMVGALADWFAVTALFHHPLGIPVPHTNLIERSKQNIGDNLGSFIVSNFLTPGNIRPYIERLDVSSFLTGWLEKEKNKELFISFATGLVRDILRRLDDDTVAGLMVAKGKELLNDAPLNRMLSQLIQYFLDQKKEQELITMLASKIKMYIEEHNDIVKKKVSEESYFFIPKFVDKKIADKIVNALVRFFTEIEQDTEHRLREDIAQYIRQWSEDLLTSPKWESKIAQMKEELLSAPAWKQYAFDLWRMVKMNLLKESGNKDSAFLLYCTRQLDEGMNRIREDKKLSHNINAWVRFTLYKYVLRNRHNVAQLISGTIGNWEGKELSEKLELEVGKDLQFIRINGTLVGGLVGLLIYTVTRLLS